MEMDDGIMERIPVEKISSITEIDCAYLGAVAFPNHIGFNYFAFSTTYFTSNNQSKAVQFNNYPTRWNLEYEQDEMSFRARGRRS